MRAVIDTNVAISATIVPQGHPGQTLKAWREGAFDWIISLALIVELDRSMRYTRVQRRHHLTPGQIALYIGEISAEAELVNPAAALDILVKDPDDNRLLEAAIAGKADYIVTGDALLLELGEYAGIQIVTPARFVAVLTTTEP